MVLGPRENKHRLGTNLSAAPSGRVVVCERALGLKPQAESCYPFGISPTVPSGTKTFITPVQEFDATTCRGFDDSLPDVASLSFRDGAKSG